MNSEILKQIGLDTIDPGIIILALTFLVIVLTVVVLIGIVQNSKLKKKYNKFMQGTKAASLESQIQSLIKNVNDLNATADNHEDRLVKIFKKHESSYQKLGLIKYDAFKEMGGMLSCCICILDENNNGIIMNNVHSSTGCYSYTKRVKKGVCELDLSPEEKISLDKAMAYVPESTPNSKSKSKPAEKSSKLEELDMDEDYEAEDNNDLEEVDLK